MKLLLVACDTTGVELPDEPISVALVLVEADDTGEWRELERWHGLQAPSVPISPAALAIHGLTAAVLAGQAFDVPRMRALFAAAEGAVSWHPRFDAKMLAKVLPDVLDKAWFEFEEHFRARGLPPVRSHLQGPRAVRQLARMLQWISVRGGKTARSKTWLASILLKGRMPVHAHVAGELQLQLACAAPTGRVFAGMLARCRVGTSFRLWTQPSMELIAAYAVGGYVAGEGLCFHLPKAGNAALAAALDRGDWVQAHLTSVQGTTYHIDIDAPVARPASPV